MLKLTSLVYTFVGATVAGILIIAALVSGFDTAEYVIAAAAIGFAAALPISWFVAKAIKSVE